MADLKQTEKLKLEKVFEMSGGYVLDFSNSTFQQFVYDITKIDIYNSKFEHFGDSKAKRLRAFWQIESDYNVGFLTKEMLDYWKTNKNLNNEKINDHENIIFLDCVQIANQLLGVKTGDKNRTLETTQDDFLKKEFKNVSLAKLGIDSTVVNVLNKRLEEIEKNLKSGASLSAVIMCGSVLEGILLGTASSNMKAFNQSISSPKDKDSGKVLQFHQWSLSNFIDVANNIGILGLDVKKFSHSLRDFRNYIHPYQQMSSGFSPDIDTAKISWQVLQAAISDLINNKITS